MRTKYIYGLSIIVLIITAIFSTGYHQFDEHFQILEFAGLKLGLTPAAQLPWEYFYRIRPALQPALVVLLYNFLSVLGWQNPFFIALLLRLFSVALAFTGMYLMYKAYSKNITGTTLSKWFLWLSFLLWFALYNNVRFSSENWSAGLLIIAFALLNLKDDKHPASCLLIGLLLGFSFVCRYQSGFMIVGLLLWVFFIKKDKLKTILIIPGIIFMIIAGIIIDRWFYGQWTLTIWNYFDQNLIQHKAAGFGTEPRWFYFYDVFIKTIPPFSIIIVLSFLLLFIYKPKDVLTWTIFPFLLVHCILAHKETRFLFPLIGFVPIVMIKGIEIIQQKWIPDIPEKKLSKILAGLFFAVNFIFVAIVAFKPANNQISLYRKLYNDYPGPAILYTTNDDPYNHIYFYRKSTLDERSIQSVKEIKPVSDKKLLFVTNDIKIADSVTQPKKLIYSTFPSWLKTFNFNNWLDRTNCYYVFELNPNTITIHK